MKLLSPAGDSSFSPSSYWFTTPVLLSGFTFEVLLKHGDMYIVILGRMYEEMCNACVCVCGGGGVSLRPCNEDESDVNFLIWAGLNMQRGN